MEKKVSGKHSSMNGFAMMKGRVATVVLASALLLGGGLNAQAQNTALTTCSQSAATAIPQNPNWKANAAEWQKLKGEITLYMTNDMGRNGYYDQKSIAELMGEMAGTVDPECPALPWAAPRRCCIFCGRSRKKGWSKGTAISQCTSTARWPSRPPASSRTPTRTASTSRPAPCWNRASTPSTCRGCGSP